MGPFPYFFFLLNLSDGVRFLYYQVFGSFFVFFFCILILLFYFVILFLRYLFFPLFIMSMVLFLRRGVSIEGRSYLFINMLLFSPFPRVEFQIYFTYSILHSESTCSTAQNSYLQISWDYFPVNQRTLTWFPLFPGFASAATKYNLSPLNLAAANVVTSAIHWADCVGDHYVILSFFSNVYMSPLSRSFLYFSLLPLCYYIYLSIYLCSFILHKY